MWRGWALGGYVLAHHEGGAQAIATVKYNGKLTYQAIMLARPDLAIAKWPDDARGKSISFPTLARPLAG